MHNYAATKTGTKVGVIGGSGYAGLELVRLLMKHPATELRICFSTKGSAFTFADYLPIRGSRALPVANISELDKWMGELDTVFLATPIDASLDLAPRLLAAGVNVIDLSGAFRLVSGGTAERLEAYQKWYGLSHSSPELLDKAEYGLIPWLPKPQGEGARLIANPGCYATSVLMALLPLLKRNLIQPETLVIDAKSGTSGAGRKPSEDLLFTEVDGECLPYRVGQHQHLPEIRHYAEKYGAVDIDPMFTTHLLGIRRGILSGIYSKTREAVTESDISSAYAEDYSDYGLVEWGTLRDKSSRSAAFNLSLKRVVGTALTRIQFRLEDGRLYLFSLIDNLIKGAAGQAIENLNRLQGLPPGTGLKELEGVL